MAQKMENTDQLLAFKQNLVENMNLEGRDPTISRLLMLSVGRVWYNDVKQHPDRIPRVDLTSCKNDDIEVMQADPHIARYHSRLHHIIDWLRAATINDEPWLHNLDAEGRPKKLMKFSTIEQISAEADKAMLIASQKGLQIELDASHEKIVQKLDDGFSVVQLLSPEALDRESAHMQHCIGHGAYDHKVGFDQFRYLSLRDASNRPHTTMELMRGDKGDWNLVQFQGKQNRLPLQKYINILTPFIREANLKPDNQMQKNIPYVIDTRGEWHALNELPTRLSCRSFDPLPNANTREDKTNVRMPDFLTVSLSASIINKKLDGFPSKIKFVKLDYPKHRKLKERLEVIGVEIENVPDEIHIGSGATFNQVLFKSAPKHISIGGNCTFAFTPGSKTPEEITVAGDLFLANIPTSVFDGKINTSKDVTFWSCKQMTSIARGIKTDGRLSIFNSEIKELPDGIDVGELLLYQTNITSLPEGIKVSKKLLIDQQHFFEHIPSSIDDDIRIEWKDSESGVMKDDTGPETVGAWRSQQLRLGM